MEKEVLLKVENYSISFRQYKTFFEFGHVTPIKRLDLTLQANSITAIVGQSGSGKSLLAHAIMDILPENSKVSGKITYKDMELTADYRKTLPKGEIVIIPQSINHLDPLMKVGKQIQSLVHTGNAKAEQEKVFARYNLSPETAELFPFQISGGMARRILIACAVVQKPKLIIADEPTPGLDNELVDETINHLIELKNNGCSILIITHDLHVATKIADNIIFFKDGESICDIPRDRFDNTKSFNHIHPYAKQLFEALPSNNFIAIDRTADSKGQNNVLEVKNLSFSYSKSKKIIENLNFSLKSCEIVGLTGKSGRGKSTLAKLLAGYLQPTEGNITINGKKNQIKGRYNPIQLVFQHPEKAVDPKWKMRRILTEAAPLSPVYQEKLGLKAEWLKRYPHELSGGELQRFCIARILHEETKFLIADEMTAMFDTYTQAQIWKVVVEYVRTNKLGMIVVSHDIDLLNRLCDRVVNY